MIACDVSPVAMFLVLRVKMHKMSCSYLETENVAFYAVFSVEDLTN